MTSEDLEPRRSRRRPIPGVLVEVEVEVDPQRRWAVDAVDISAQGMGLVFPDQLDSGTAVLLTFRLDDKTALSRVPATVQHREPGVGGVRFESWDPHDRLALLEYLVQRYEHDS